MKRNPKTKPAKQLTANNVKRPKGGVRTGVRAGLENGRFK